MNPDFYLIRFFCVVAIIFAAGCDSGHNNGDKQRMENTVVTDTVFASRTDSLEWVFNNPDFSVDDRLDACNHLSYSLVYNNVNKAHMYAKMGLEMAIKNENITFISHSYRNLGNTYVVKTDMDSALICYQNALNHAVEINDEDLEQKVYQSFGVLYNAVSKFDSAIQYYGKALVLCEKNGYNNDLPGVLNSLGSACLNVDNIDLAQQYFLKAQDLLKDVDDSPYKATTYHRLSMTYRVQRKFDEALELLEETIKIAQSQNNKRILSYACLDLAQIYAEEKEQYDKALEFSLRGLSLAEETGYAFLIKYAFGALSTVYSETGNYKQSENYALKMFELIDTADYASMSEAYYNYLIPVYIRQSKTEDALNALDEYLRFFKKEMRMEAQHSLLELETKYETGKKELKVAALEKEKRLMTWLSIAGGAVLLLALAAFFFLWRLTVQKKRLSEQKVKQLEQEKQLTATQAVLDGETRERTRLARDLHDGLGSMLSFVKLNLPEMKSGVVFATDDAIRFKTAISMLDDSISELRRIAHHMMPGTLMRYGLKASLSDFCRSIPSVKFHYFGNDQRLDSKLEILIYRAIHEMISNALKHAEATQINVQMVQEDNRISLTVQDDGKGFDPAAKTEGMGLENIRNRMETCNGKMTLYSSPGNGTEINIEIELKITN